MKQRLEDYEYSEKAASDSQSRAQPTVEQQQKVDAYHQRQAHQVAQQVAATQRRIEAARKPFDSEETLAKALLQLQAATGVKVGIERPRGKRGKQ